MRVENYCQIPSLTDPEILDATYNAFVKTVAKKPYPTLKGIQFLLDEVAAKLPNAKTAKPEQFCRPFV
jgi:hypothetical protein